MNETDSRPAVVGQVEPSVRPLPKTQRELLEAMRQGVRVIYMPYQGWFNPQAYYFRDDTQKRVTAAATALLEKRLVRRAKDGRTDVLVAAA